MSNKIDRETGGATSAAAPLGRLESVSDTAWFVAALRAVESERPDAAFSDPAS